MMRSMKWTRPFLGQECFDFLFYVHIALALLDGDFA